MSTPFPPSVPAGADLASLSINTLRFLAVDAVQAARSGHPGMPMGAASMAYVLWKHHMKYSPAHPDWFDRDRFVLSAGHGSMLLYGMLHLAGYAMPMEEIKQFRQWGSITPGHPENFLAEGVETTTGPLGQGFANAVGMAMAEKHLAARFNEPGFEIVDHFTYGICSDGDLMEGVSHEAASLAGHLGLGKLIFLYDDNGISIDGGTELSFTENVPQRFAAYGWHVDRITDGNDLEAIDQALHRARAEADRPSLIAVRTVIGYGSPNKAGSASSHGSPLGEEEVVLAKRCLGWPEDKTFFVPDEVYAHMRDASLKAGHAAYAAWEERLAAYRDRYPEQAEIFAAWCNGSPEEGWAQRVETPVAGTVQATRAASGKALNELAPSVPFLIGGSADLTPSNNTAVKDREDFQKTSPMGGYLRFGVREHAMASACNGIALHGAVRPYCATFLIFSDYMRPAVRLSALMKLPVLYIFTHDSIGLGEDGPTHQPIEHIMSLRAMPNLTVIRPADAAETAEAWKLAVEWKDGPLALILTRQGLPVLEGTGEGLRRGAYVVFACEGTPDIVLIGTGSEVQHAVAAATMLRETGVAAQVVSMPSWELFEQQQAAYREEVFPRAVRKRLAVEAGVTTGWERYVGLDGAVIGMTGFGASAPGGVTMREFGFTAENVLARAQALLAE